MYLVTRKDRVDYDEYVGFVVLANGPSQARKIAHTATGSEPRYRDNRFLHAAYVKVAEIRDTGDPHVILSSFRAG
jgi:hypothetical protein